MNNIKISKIRRARIPQQARLSSIFIVFILIGGSVLAILPQRVNAATYVYVDDDYNQNTPGWGVDHFDNIQDGVNAVDYMGTVYVKNGIYRESVTITHRFFLAGENQEQTIIQNINTVNCIYVSQTDDFSISKFNLTGGLAGIDIEGSNGGALSEITCYNTGIGVNLHDSTTGVSITNCVFTSNSNGWGVQIDGSSQNSIFRNTIHCWRGIQLSTHEPAYHNSIYENEIISEGDTGIYMYTSSHNNSIFDNTIEEYACGIFCYNGRENTFETNVITSCYDGIYLTGQNTKNTISECTISSNEHYGIYIQSQTTRTTILKNTISNNAYGIWSETIYGSNHKIYNNNFIDNTENARDCGSSSSWDNGYVSGGNYWSDYTGIDEDGDNTGDTPYYICSYSVYDNYPLMYTWGECPPTANFTYSINEKTVTFDGSFSFDRDGGVQSYLWDLGNGQTRTYTTFTYTYPYWGTYTVSLTVTDNEGKTNTHNETLELFSGSTPNIIMSYDQFHCYLRILSSDQGFYYSTSTSPADAQLIFKKSGVNYYVLNDLTVGTSGVLSTKEIATLDYITEFPQGTYQVIWNPTSTMLFEFTVTGTPQINFTTNQTQHTITVVSISPSGIPWSYISNVGSGGCTFPFGNINVGDVITDCYGTVSLMYNPLSILLYTHQFLSQDIPQINFTANQNQHTLTVNSVTPSGMSWNDIHFTGQWCTLPTGTIDAGDAIIECYGTIYLWHTPTTTLLASFVFSTMTTPSITFNQNLQTKTLTVTAVERPTIAWATMYNYGSGTCQFPGGTVDVGDTITSCYGTIRIFFIPTQTVLAEYVFTTAVTPQISFIQNTEQRTLTVSSIDLSGIPWNDIHVAGSITIPGGTIEVGDVMTDAYGSLAIIYRPNGATIATYEFPQPESIQIGFTMNYAQQTITVETLYSLGLLWSDIQNIGSGSCSLPQGTIDTGDVITECIGIVILQYVPTGDTLGSFEFSETPQGITFSYHANTNTVTITAVPDDLYYSSSTQQSGAILVFTWTLYNPQTEYVLADSSIGSTGDLLTKQIEAGDHITGFPQGSYKMVWKPTGEILGEFTVTSTAEPIPLTIYGHDRETPYYEGLPFSIQVMEYNETRGYEVGAENAMVLFNGQTYTTISSADSVPSSYYGIVTFIAPQVTSTQSFSITVSLEGYASTTRYVTITDHSLTYGRVYGYVYLESEESNQREPAPHAIIEFAETVPNGGWRDIVYLFSDDDGAYSCLSAFTNEYRLTAQYRSYRSDITYVDMQNGKDIEADLLLKVPELRYTIEETAKSGNLGAEIVIQTSEQYNTFEHDVFTYNGVTITPVLIQKNQLQVIVSGDELSGARTVLLTIDPTLFDTDDLQVTFDGQPISIAESLEDAMDPNNDGSNPEYYLVVTGSDITAFVTVPHFSDHTISIQSLSQVVEAVGGITAVIMYIVIIGIVGIVYIIPIWVFKRK